MNIFLCLFIALCIVGFFVLLYKFSEWLDYNFDIDCDYVFSMGFLVFIITVVLYIISNVK